MVLYRDKTSEGLRVLVEESVERQDLFDKEEIIVKNR